MRALYQWDSLLLVKVDLRSTSSWIRTIRFWSTPFFSWRKSKSNYSSWLVLSNLKKVISQQKKMCTLTSFPPINWYQLWISSKQADILILLSFSLMTNKRVSRQINLKICWRPCVKTISHLAWEKTVAKR